MKRLVEDRPRIKERWWAAALLALWIVLILGSLISDCYYDRAFNDALHQVEGD